MIEHIGFEVSDLERTARFYDAVFFALGARRLVESEHLVAYGINAPLFFFVTRAPSPPAPGYGHLALRGQRQGGRRRRLRGGAGQRRRRRRPARAATAVRAAVLRRISA